MPTYAAFAPGSTDLSASSPTLLATTPPVVVRALCQIFPLIAVLDKFMALLTWTDDDQYQSFLLIIGWVLGVSYFEMFVNYFFHIGIALTIAGVWYLNTLKKSQTEEPSLDLILSTIGTLSSRLTLFLLPYTSLELTPKDITRLVFTAFLTSPIYVVLTHFIFSVRQVVILFGIYVLSYHSMWARVTRAIFWRSKVVRVIVFHCTGIDFSRAAQVKRPPWTSEDQANSSELSIVNNTDKDSQRHVKFTYTIYENQRRWLGIGWTANLLTYERAPWTDKFLNETASPAVFTLPDSEGTGMQWNWVDTTWKVDLTNGGSLVPRSKAKLTPDPDEDDGFIYTDNTWKRPSAEYSYSKYTRRRRWVRTAELVSTGIDPPLDDDQDHSVHFESEKGTIEIEQTPAEFEGSTATEISESNLRQRKTRFVDDN